MFYILLVLLFCFIHRNQLIDLHVYDKNVVASDILRTSDQAGVFRIVNKNVCLYSRKLVFLNPFWNCPSIQC